ncbi:MAG: YbaN family protein [Ignavibacteria bacterium]
MRWILIVTGTVMVGIGILGIFLPLLPTTIFFLLAAACYARSSEKFYIWLLHNRWFGKYIRNYKQGHGMTLKSKIFSLSLMWAAILYSAIFVTENIYVRLILFLIAAGVTWHLIAIKTARQLD